MANEETFVIILNVDGQNVSAEYKKLYDGLVGALKLKLSLVNWNEDETVVRFSYGEREPIDVIVNDEYIDVPPSVIKSPGFTVAVGGYLSDGESLKRFIPSASVHIAVSANGYGSPDNLGTIDFPSLEGQLIAIARTGENLPRIGADGNWEFYDVEAKAYVNSGMQARGVKGDTGAQGPQGEKGDKGDTGARGPQGDAGKDGYTPKKGIDYWTNSDKAEVIAEAILAAQQTEDIDVSKLINPYNSQNNTKIKLKCFMPNGEGEYEGKYYIYLDSADGLVVGDNLIKAIYEDGVFIGWQSREIVEIASDPWTITLASGFKYKPDYTRGYEPKIKNGVVFAERLIDLETNEPIGSTDVIFEPDDSQYLHLEGNNNIGVFGSVVEGSFNIAASFSAHVEGTNNIASGHESHVEGESCTASGKRSHAEGSDCTASGSTAHAEGSSSQAVGKTSHAEGHHTKAIGWASHSEGFQTIASGDFQHVQGTYNVEDTENKYVHIVGNGSTKSGIRSNAHTLDWGGNAWFAGNITDGMGNKLSDKPGKKVNIGAEIFNGNNNVATGDYAHAEGVDTQALGNYSHTEGFGSITSGSISHAEGYETVAEGSSAHAEGGKTIATGQESHAEGRETIANAIRAHAEGYLSKAWGAYSHAEGFNTYAQGEDAHAEGRDTQALGVNSHAEGYQGIAYMTSSHVEGCSCEAMGNASHAEGRYTNAKGMYSHAEGEGTIAAGARQHVEGMYNIEDTGYTNFGPDIGDVPGKYVHIVGNGIGDIYDDNNNFIKTDRSNAHTLDWDGNAWYQGTVETAGIILTSPSGKKFKITVDNNGVLSTTQI